MAAQSLGSVKFLVQPPKLSLEAIATDAFLLAFGQHLEEEFGAAAIEFHVAEFVDAEQIDPAVTGDGLGQDHLVGGLDQFVDQLRGQGVADPVAGHGGFGAQAMSRWDLPVPESPIRQSGRPFFTQSQVAKVWTTAGSTLGFASKSNVRNDFSRGNAAALMRRSERRRARSSHSAISSSARNPR